MSNAYIIAVIGGIVHLEGAWVGAFIFLGANIYLRDIPGLGSIGGFVQDRILAEDRFNTVVGILLLIIMLGSPDGVTGLILRLRDAIRGALSRGDDEVVAVPAGDASGSSPPTHTPDHN